MAESDVPAGYTLLEGYPSVDDYVHLRTASGLTPKSAEQAAAAIKGSWYGVWAAEESDPGVAVAMGRIIGDGGVSYFYLVLLLSSKCHEFSRGQMWFISVLGCDHLGPWGLKQVP